MKSCKSLGWAGGRTSVTLCSLEGVPDYSILADWKWQHNTVCFRELCVLVVAENAIQIGYIL